jgi:cellulose synthase (UDP-forming)
MPDVAHSDHLHDTRRYASLFPWKASARDQAAGLAALIAIARQIQRDGDEDGVHRDGHRTGAKVDVRPPPDTSAMAIHIDRISHGGVRVTTRYGPVIAHGNGYRELSRGTFGGQLRPSDRVIVAVLSALWGLFLADFWIWWLKPAHQTSVYGSMLNALVLAYLTVFPVFFVVAVNRLRSVSQRVDVPRLRVAFIVTRAPSEPWEVARKTLLAMLDQDFPVPYDVWLADESPTREILSWCAGSGVIVSTRNGVGEYHRPTWPRRTKCKEGNLAFFYDHWGYRSYDVVAQLDCDHVPAPQYLAEIVRPFSDPAVGYVSAPSICDANAASSWPARGRLYAEATFHGAFQLGHSAGWSPLCIGSHYAVRTTALRDIGGIGPELAEDFSTTFLLNTAGWHGAFAINAEAHGDGPATFAAMLVQEFQWSKSLTVLLLNLVPRNLTRLDLAHRFRFTYALAYYLVLTVATVTGVLLAPVAVVTGQPWMNVNYLAFLAHWWALSAWLILLAALLKRRGLLRPADAPLFSWENWLYILVRWPYVARGVCSALLYVIRPRAVTFKVTPKGAGGLEVLPARLLCPHVGVSLLCSVPAIIGEQSSHAAGYVFLCVLGAVTYCVVCLIVAVLHAKEMGRRAGAGLATAIRRTSLPPLLLGMLSLAPSAYAAARYPAYASHAFHWNLRAMLTGWQVRWGWKYLF